MERVQPGKSGERKKNRGTTKNEIKKKMRERKTDDDGRTESS